MISTNFLNYYHIDSDLGIIFKGSVRKDAIILIEKVRETTLKGEKMFSVKFHLINGESNTFESFCEGTCKQWRETVLK